MPVTSPIHSLLHLSDKSATADDLKKGANVAVKAVMEPTMKVTIGLPTCPLQIGSRSSPVSGWWLPLAPSPCLHAQLILARPRETEMRPTFHF